MKPLAGLRSMAGGHSKITIALVIVAAILVCYGIMANILLPTTWAHYELLRSFDDPPPSLLNFLSLSFPQAEVLNRGRQSLGFVGPAVARDFRRVLLKGVIVQNGAIGSRIVISANPKADEISVLLAISEPAPASDLVHIYSDLSRARD
jgi:hypothetical protein